MGLRLLDRTSEGGERRLAAGLASVFFLVALLAGLDIAGDLGAGAPLEHLAVEGVVLLVGLVGFVWMAARLRALLVQTHRLSEHAADLASRLDASDREAARWRQEASDLIAGLSDAIDRQLERWGLSPAEKEVALLLLKGLSHKEVGQARNVSEGTVRQQARAIYEKAGLGGRHDLAAFFLEDLLGPRPSPKPTGTSV